MATIILFLALGAFVLLCLFADAQSKAQRRETAIMNMIVALHYAEQNQKPELLTEARKECLAVISSDGVLDVQSIIIKDDGKI